MSNAFTPVQETTRHLVVGTANLVCGLPLAAVRETMRPLRIEPLEARGRGVVGVAVIRGEAAPVVDLALLLGQPARSSYGRFVTLSGARGGLTALAVERVLGIEDVEPSGMHGLPALVDSCDHDAVERLRVADAGLMLLLERARILAGASLEEAPR